MSKLPWRNCLIACAFKACELGAGKTMAEIDETMPRCVTGVKPSAPPIGS